jgi:hypothetical protein
MLEQLTNLDRTTLRIGGLVILIAAYALHQRELFILYHFVRMAALLGGHHQ